VTGVAPKRSPVTPARYVAAMAWTVDGLFDAAGAASLGAAPWQARVPPEAPSVYVVARTDDPAALVPAPPLSMICLSDSA
jgi:hypothetical protein